MWKHLFSFSICLLIIIQTQAQRNTILIIADDLGTDYFGFYENHVDTVDVPNIRGLLAKGVRFKNYYSNPVCSSTRSTLLTGRYGFRTGVGYIVGAMGGSGQIDTAEMSIPKLLKLHNSNIAKANIGKWHLKQPNPAVNLLSPQALGYDWFEGPFIGAIPSYTNWTKYTNGVSSTITNYATTENVNNAVSWLKSINSSQPFFLWLAFNAPHDPIHLPPANLHTYTSLSGTPADINAQPKAYFKAMIQALDTEIGRLFDSLQVMNKFDSTDIIFIGDNGNTSRTAQIANIAKSKGTVYEYGIHVPLIISGPSVVNPGRSSQALVNSVDLFATIVENFGFTNWQTQLPANKPVDSKSLQPILKNVSDSIRPWAFSEIFKQTTDSIDAKAMRNRDYKLIKFDYGFEEFYSLTNDPQENTNLLNGNLTTTDISNYYYLCNEMTTLIGSGSFCQNGVGINVLDVNEINIYPNPFIDKISIQIISPNEFVQLLGNEGQLIYEGNEIEKQDFSYLSKGIYFLKIKNRTITLIKE